MSITCNPLFVEDEICPHFSIETITTIRTHLIEYGLVLYSRHDMGTFCFSSRRTNNRVIKKVTGVYHGGGGSAV